MQKRSTSAKPAEDVSGVKSGASEWMEAIVLREFALWRSSWTSFSPMPIAGKKSEIRDREAKEKQLKIKRMVPVKKPDGGEKEKKKWGNNENYFGIVFVFFHKPIF